MALYEVTLRQRYNAQQALNVWSYYVAPGLGISPTSLELLTLMGFIPEEGESAPRDNSIASYLQTLQNTSVEWLTIEARELYSVTDFYEGAYSPAWVGLYPSDSAMSPFNAYGAFSARVRTDIRRGFKRFVGVSEGAVGAFGALVAGQLSTLTTLCERMSEILDGATAVYEPCVISRRKVVDEETGKVTYELYPDPAVQEEHTAHPLVWAPYTTVRTQNSRTVGRGA